MATPEEIDHRVHEVDTPRTARRAAAARQVSDLARRRAGIVEQLEGLERALGDVLADAQDVVGIDELADFTDVKAADLTQWLATRRPSRVKRKKSSASAASTQADANPRTAASETSVSQAPTRRSPAPAHAGTRDASG